ncbi:family 20 glycosylhydrolase [Gluconobacter cerinus]|uniref:beta-N-acetylhexosaminidase n=1 Tax=Gluconobacter cerinus TaxID=38307 RepID=UPI001B8D28E1|nr:family 20 glycosylhydrolase [Gluconobacter cerinus]MBS1046887.1 family 20 glycosylhydrolase [Gluconobacter cerinus]
MKKRLQHALALSGVLLSSVCAFSLSQAHAQSQKALSSSPVLLPVPAHVSLSSRSVPFQGVKVVWDGKATALEQRAVARFLGRLEKLQGGSGNDEPKTVLHIRAGQDPAYLTVNEREGYSLSVKGQNIQLEAGGPAGVIHGLATLLQLVQAGPSGRQIAEGDIQDAPRFSWRGLMIDVSRHFMSVETMERQLDAMELTKLNVLHWHLSDGTGFRIQSLRYPKLQDVGAHHQYYTQSQVRSIVQYAADRGIRVVPEIDVPGHTLSLLQAYPELAAQQPVLVTDAAGRACTTSSADGQTTTNCSRRPNLNNAALNPVSPQVIDFAANLYAEIGRLFPDRYIHSGGDEVQDQQWLDNPAIVSYMKANGYKDVPALQAAFTAKIEKALAAQGKIMMGWDEVSEAPIPKDVVVEVWRNAKWTGSATKAGHPVVVSAGYYLDLLYSSANHYAVDPDATRPANISAEDAERLRHQTLDRLERAFAPDPDMAPLDEAQRKLVLGGEAPLWAEIVSDEMLDARLWPRSAAIAERFWSPETVQDVDDLYRRLPVVMNELESTGLLAREHTDRMIAELTPSNITPLTVLTSVTVPVQNYALNHLAGPTGDAMLKSPAAIASPDSFSAIEFNALAKHYAAGDKSAAAQLRASLSVWAANDAAYEQVATTPQLQLAEPVSKQLSQLAQIGLEAMEPGAHNRAWHKKAQQLLAEQDLTLIDPTSFAGKERVIPPSGLLIAIVPGIHALVQSAR